jgi:predicted nucleic-acid-binding protein
VSVAIDTNVLVRLLVRDDEIQFAAAKHVVDRAAEQGEPVLLLFGMLLEAEWVLRSRYKVDKAAIIDAYTQLLETDGVQHEDEAAVEEAIFRWKDHPKADFTDCMLAARASRLGCTRFVTFDAGAAGLPGAEWLR